jgi:hypothetical protein
MSEPTRKSSAPIHVYDLAWILPSIAIVYTAGVRVW